MTSSWMGLSMSSTWARFLGTIGGGGVVLLISTTSDMDEVCRESRFVPFVCDEDEGDDAVVPKESGRAVLGARVVGAVVELLCCRTGAG